MIGSFKNYLVEEEREVFFTFGRMNPPTIGHQKLLDKLASVAGRMPYFVYLSQSQDSKKNPLDYKTKVKTVRKMFPRHARSIILEKSCKNAMECAVKLYNQGYKNITMVVGQDRMREFDVLLKKYNGQKARHGFYNFNKINIVSAGDRDPDAEGAEGMSASKMRSAASDNDFTTFAQGLPKGFSNAESKKLFNAVRNGMGLKETKEFTKHIQLEPVSDIRESYIRDRIFEEGETVVLPKKGSIVGKITHLGANYLIVESKGEVHRCWLDDVNKLDPTNYVPHWDQAPFPDYPKPELGLTEATDRWYKDQPEWGTPEGTKHAKKITPGQNEGLWDNIRARRKAGKPKLKPGQKGYPKTLNIEKTTTPQDPDIKDREGSQPKAHYAGLSKATKKARDTHFDKHGPKADNDPSAYKPAPGDATAKTKPSKHTLKFKQMFGDDIDEDAVARAKARIDREKKADAIRHDRVMDRARILQTLRKNRETDPRK